jgi:SAM-dependent methyltransferase
MAQLDKKVERFSKQHDEDRLILRRIASVLDRSGTGGHSGGDDDDIEELALPSVGPSAPGDWKEWTSCPLCFHAASTPVSEYNRFLLADAAPDETSKIYNYSLCHGCGSVYAARRPVGRRFRELLTGFHENLGRVGTPSAWLNPGKLTADDRQSIHDRVRHGWLVSEHAQVPDNQWLRGAFRDRLAVSQHVELIGALLTLDRPRVLEIRPRTGAISDSLRRLYAAQAFTLPIFESQQEIVRGLYGIPADALVDFEQFQIPYQGPFDLVVSNHMLTHALAPADFLDTISQALAPGGHLYLYNEMDEAEYLSSPATMFRTLNPFHMQVFTAAALERALSLRGFDVVFLGHSDAIHMVCLARKATPKPAAMPEAERKRRLKKYREARDLSILALPEPRRAPFASEWQNVVERAVVSGLVTIDERGRVQFRRDG